MTKWLRAEQNLESLLIMPNISMRDWFREVETFADIYYVSRLLLRLQFWMKFMDITSTKFTVFSLQWWANKDDNFTSPAQLSLQITVGKVARFGFSGVWGFVDPCYYVRDCNFYCCPHPPEVPEVIAVFNFNVACEQALRGALAAGLQKRSKNMM